MVIEDELIVESEQEPVMITLGILKDLLKQQIPKKIHYTHIAEPFNKCIIVLRLKI